MNVLGLFSGIGGFELGLERAGMRIIAMCEIDEYCRNVLHHHWPKVPIFTDIRELSGRTFNPPRNKPRRFPVIDVICGGFPCQGISEAGLRQGLQDPRSGLWREYARIIGEIRPKYVIVENVSEILRDGYGMGEVLGDLAKIGYDSEWHSIPALAVGADHIRERIWIIAYPDSTRLEPVYERGRQQCTAQMGQDVAETSADAISERPRRRMQTRTLREDARAISPWLGLALSTATPFPGLDGAGSPVLGRGENGIPDRVDRVMSLGNAVVPQIPEMIGRAIIARDSCI